MIALFDKYQKWAIRTAMSAAKKRGFLIPIPLIEQGALIGLWRAARRYDKTGKKSFKTFAYCHVVGGMLDEYQFEHDSRKSKTYKLPSIRIEAREYPYEDIWEAARPCPVDDADACMMLLAMVPKECRDAVYLRHYVGLDNAAIGKALGVSVSRVYQMVKDGLHEARRNLERRRHAVR